MKALQYYIAGLFSFVSVCVPFISGKPKTHISIVNKSSSGLGKLSLGTIFFTVFLDLVGVGIVLPVTVPLLLNPQSALLPVHFSEAVRTVILGFLIASYPIASFFGGPF